MFTNPLILTHILAVYFDFSKLGTSNLYYDIFQVMKSKEIIGEVPDENFVVSGHHLPLKSEINIGNGDTKDFLTELEEFVHISKNDDTLKTETYESKKKSNSKKSRGKVKKQENKVALMERPKKDLDHLETEVNEFIQITKIKQKVMGKNKLKRKLNVSNSKSKFKITGSNMTRDNGSRRRSQRLRGSQSAVNTSGDI